MKFGITKDFDSAKCDIVKTRKSLELLKTYKDDYTVLLHEGDHVYELVTFSKGELMALWKMMSIK